MQDIRESDWRGVRQLADVAMERFFAKTLRETEEMLRRSDGDSREQFWRVHSLMTERRVEAAELFGGLSRSKAKMRLLTMRSRGLITEEELKRFSPELVRWLEETLRSSQENALGRR